jgi:AraC-like DNA-binding protein
MGMNGDDILARHRDWMHIKTNLVWIYEGEILESTRQKAYPPGDLAAWLIIDGEVSLEAQGKTVQARSGEWILPWPGRRYQSFAPHTRLLSIRFQATWPDGRPLFDHGLSVAFRAELHPELEQSARHLLAIARNHATDDPLGFTNAQLPFDIFLKIKAALLQWIAQYYRVLIKMGIKPTRLGIGDDRVAKALVQLDKLPLDRKFHEVDIAGDSGLSDGQFVRVFREEVGVTPKRYFEERRRDFCRRMLAITEVPIKEVAHELGFIRLSDFSSWTHSFCGMSPRQFRLKFGDKKPA